MTDLLLVPYGEIPEEISWQLSRDLVRQGYQPAWYKVLTPPLSAYNYERRQYRADALLDSLRYLSDESTPDEFLSAERVLAVTNTDIYVYVQDYIKGFADLPGQFALISIARLQAEPELLAARAEKLALHELGHTYGLEHCPDPVCVMHAAECMADIDFSASRLCASCQQLRIAKQQQYADLFSVD